MLGPCFRLVLEDSSKNSSIISEKKARKKKIFCPYLKSYLKRLGTPRLWSRSMKSVRVWYLCQNCAFCQVISFWKTKICKNRDKLGKQTGTWAGLERKKLDCPELRSQEYDGERRRLLPAGRIGKTKLHQGGGKRHEDMLEETGWERSSFSELFSLLFLYTVCPSRAWSLIPWLAGSNPSLLPGKPYSDAPPLLACTEDDHWSVPGQLFHYVLGRDILADNYPKCLYDATQCSFISFCWLGKEETNKLKHERTF